MQKVKAKVAFPGVPVVLWPCLGLKAAVSSAGSAIAYSAYTFPDALICSTFHDCYVALAVLNTILSTGLSCYSRYGHYGLKWEAGEDLACVPMGDAQ